MERLMHANGRGSLTASLAETAKHYERGNMILKDALPTRKVKIELHVLDQNGKTLDELESDSRNESFLDTWGSMEYDYMIPLTKRYIFYVRKGAENDDR